jgi:hypothetical protein
VSLFDLTRSAAAHVLISFRHYMRIIIALVISKRWQVEGATDALWWCALPSYAPW